MGVDSWRRCDGPSTATIAPMLFSAPDRIDVGAHVRREVPPAPAPTGLERQRIDSARIALDSTASPMRRPVRGGRRPAPGLAPTMAVDPPTEPAMCTRISGLPVAPAPRRGTTRASSRPRTGHRRLADDDRRCRRTSNRSRPRLVDGLAHQAVHRDVLAFGDVLQGLPGTRTGQIPAILALQDRNQILLQRRPLVAWARTLPPIRRRCAARRNRCAPGPRRTSGWRPVHRRTGSPAVDGQSDRLGEDQLLMAERRETRPADGSGVPARGHLRRHRRRR